MVRADRVLLHLVGLLIILVVARQTTTAAQAAAGDGGGVSMTMDLATSIFLLAFIVVLTNIASALWAIARALRERQDLTQDSASGTFLPSSVEKRSSR